MLKKKSRPILSDTCEKIIRVKETKRETVFSSCKARDGETKTNYSCNTTICNFGTKLLTNFSLLFLLFLREREREIGSDLERENDSKIVLCVFIFGPIYMEWMRTPPSLLSLTVDSALLNLSHISDLSPLPDHILLDLFLVIFLSGFLNTFEFNRCEFVFNLVICFYIPFWEMGFFFLYKYWILLLIGG